LAHAIIPELERAVAKASSAAASVAAGTGAAAAVTKQLLEDAVTAEHIAQVVSTSTGIPLATLTMSERDKLLHMEDALRKRVVGQDQAVSAVANLVRQSRAGLRSKTRPQGVFLFLGPTGTGKTELCKALAGFLFDDDQYITRIDMSEYMEKHSVSRLIGAPPGYIGYEEGGVLTEAIRRRPYQVVLLDELEKAHRDVTNLLLQIFDEGRLTDSHGRTVDFRNTIIIMTSNLGSSAYNDAPLRDAATTQQEVMKAVRGHLSPELINRIDETIVFNRLGRKDMGAIVDKELATVQDTLMRDRQIALDVAPEVKELLCDEGYDSRYGARPLRRAVQHILLNELSLRLLDGHIADGSHIRAVLDRASAAGGGTSKVVIEQVDAPAVKSS